MLKVINLWYLLAIPVVLYGLFFMAFLSLASPEGYLSRLLAWWDTRNP